MSNVLLSKNEASLVLDLDAVFYAISDTEG